MTPRAGKAADRLAALNLIREARQWFELHEPSSPIPVLLRHAEQFVGKRYVDVVNAVPAELLAQWEAGGMASSRGSAFADTETLRKQSSINARPPPRPHRPSSTS